MVFAGANGSGKTSVLEAVHLLSTGRSFRSRSAQDLVSFGEDRLRIVTRAQDAQGQALQLGLEKRRDGSSRVRVNGEDLTRRSELARLLPSLIVTPDSQRLLSDGSDARRRLVDWLMFHVEPEYHDAHRRFRQALRQRNSMLRSLNRQAAVAEAWDNELAETGQRVQSLRARHVSTLETRLSALLAELCSVAVRLRFEAGWESESESFAALLERCWTRDAARGFTVQGPQRADLQFTVRERLARDVLSRGESKLLTVAVQIALARLLEEMADRLPVMLVDELASELDASNRALFFAALRETGAQTLVTTVDAALVTTAAGAEARIFDVRGGAVTARDNARHMSC